MQYEGIKNREIEKRRNDAAPGEITSYFLTPEELEKYRSMKHKTASASELSHIRFKFDFW